MIYRLALILVFVLLSIPAFAEMPSPLEVAKQLGMSDAEIERVKKGEVAVEELAASSDKDLSIALVAKLDAPLEEVYAFLQSDRLLEISTVTIAAGEIDTSTFSMAALELPEAALQRLIDDPEDSFHMSKDEAALIVGAAKKGKAEALEAYQGVLSARARAYWEMGVAGITPYAKDGRSPREDLDHANAAAKELIRNAAVLAELDVIPSKSTGKAKHRLSWAVQQGRKVAAPILDHRILYAENDGEVSIVRRFYSGYDYDSLQIVTGILQAIDERTTVAFYLNHTYTSQVAGFGGGAKRAIGRKLMQEELVAELERAQAALREK